MRTYLSFVFSILFIATSAYGQQAQTGPKLIRPVHPNSVRGGVSQALLGRYGSNVRVRYVGAVQQQNVPKHIYLVTKLDRNAKPNGEAELVSYQKSPNPWQGNNYERQFSRLGKWEARQLGLLTQEMAFERAQKTAPKGKFAEAKGELYSVGTATYRRGSFKFLQVLSKPIVEQGSWGTLTHRTLVRYVTPFGQETARSVNPEYKRNPPTVVTRPVVGQPNP